VARGVDTCLMEDTITEKLRRWHIIFERGDRNTRVRRKRAQKERRCGEIAEAIIIYRAPRWITATTDDAAATAATDDNARAATAAAESCPLFIAPLAIPIFF